MSNVRVLLIAAGLVLGGGCGGATVVAETTTEEVVAAESPLITGGSEANFGSVSLTGGFLPDPHTVPVVSGATAADSVDVSSIGISPSNSGTCRGFATSRPDFILNYASPAQLLRFRVEAPGDTTLVINDGAGNWWCSDDDGGNLNPLIEMTGPVAGQYDIWVGSYQAGANIQGALHISELPGT